MEHQFALCIRKAQDDDLEVRKVYRVLPAATNETGFLRVIDESDEDYLYPANDFVLLDLPQEAEQAFSLAA
ncbi:MAG: hypothetical protein M3Y56_03920 [Armatimonadota bacterium]|nr:hypothetical protein [Armatimonadota bacterium]